MKNLVYNKIISLFWNFFGVSAENENQFCKKQGNIQQSSKSAVFRKLFPLARLKSTTIFVLAFLAMQRNLSFYCKEAAIMVRFYQK